MLDLDPPLLLQVGWEEEEAARPAPVYGIQPGELVQQGKPDAEERARAQIVEVSDPAPAPRAPLASTRNPIWVRVRVSPPTVAPETRLGIGRLMPPSQRTTRIGIRLI